MATQRTYRNRYLRMHRTYEKRATKEIEKVFKNWFKKVNWEELSANYAIEIENSFDVSELYKAYVVIYKEIGKKHGARVLKDIKKEKNDELTRFLLQFDISVEEFLRQYGLEKVKTVQRSLYDDIINLMVKRLEEGGDIRQIGKEIQKAVNKPSFYRWRALRIARTESTAASNYGALQSARVGKYEMVKEWISANDVRTRRRPEDEYDHLHMNGKRVGLDEDFIFNQGFFNEDRLQFPGDPKGQAGNIINCRCTVAVVPKRDKNGNKIVRNGF